MKGTVLNIQHFSLHDGPGIRTVVFLKGCPLRCLWCHNPESNTTRPQLAVTESRCIRCGACLSVCPEGVFTLRDGVRGVDFSRCTGCGRCEEECMAGALEIMGKEREAEEVMDEVLRDLPYFTDSGGGLTVSGGEPTLQADFAEVLLRTATAHGINTAVETCGFAPWAGLEKLLPVTDTFLYDLKILDAAAHKAATGADNALIHENLRRLAEHGASVIIRMPVIPGYTDSPANFEAAADLILSLPASYPVEVLSYNEMAGSKHPRLGLTYALAGVRKDDGHDPEALAEILRRRGLKAAART